MSEQYIAVDNTAESGSDYVEGSEYSTQSLTSSIYEYRYENGRRYHAFQDGKYALPNDETEQDRLDIVHHICSLMLNGELHTAPISANPQRILDVGTGTGIWAIDCGERYPSAEVIGFDLSPIQPNWVPPNVQFQVDDAESAWTWTQKSFDLVHIRHLAGGIKDWPELFREAYHATKPGGWIDACEYDVCFFSDDGTLAKDSNLVKWYRLVSKAAEQTGRSLTVADTLKPLLENAGFEDVRRVMHKLPLGTWPADPKQKELGAFFLLVSESGFEALGMAFLTRLLGMDQGEVEILVQGCKNEAKSRKVHAYVKMYFYCGQRPLEKK